MTSPDLTRDLAAKIHRLLDRDQPWPRWMTVATASRYCDLSDVSIRRLLSAGMLKAHRVMRGRILIDRLELDRLIGGATGAVRVGRGLSDGSRQSREIRAAVDRE